MPRPTGVYRTCCIGVIRMKSLRSVTLTAVALSLSTASIAQTVQDPSAQCSIDLTSKPEFADIRDKLPIGDLREITFAMLANDALPSARERDGIAAWFAGREECRKVGESFRQANYPPEVNNQLTVSLTAFNEIGVDLYKGRISYGEANKRFGAARDELVTKITDIVQQYKKEIAAAQAQAAAQQSQAESQRLQAASQESQAAAQAEALRQQRMQMILNYTRANRIQLPPPPNLQIRQPVTSNCVINGNQANCTSY